MKTMKSFRGFSLIFAFAFALSCTLTVACPFHDHGFHHAAEGDGDSASWETLAHEHHDHENRQLLVGDFHRRHHHGNAQDHDLYAGPHRRKGLPKGFKLCGSPEPSLSDRIKLGEAFAEFDYKHGFGEYESRNLRSSSSTRQLVLTNVTKVPVYFHIFLKNATYGMITQTQIQKGFMAAVNKAFNGSGFKFVFKNVSYHVNATWFACNDSELFHKLTYVGGPSTMNVWICDLASQGLGGTSYIPPILDIIPYLDGVNVMNPALANAENVIFAHQAFVHEVGHYMGLVHTFVDACDNSSGYYWSNYSDYYFTGDGIKDTPAHAGPTWNYKPKSYCWQNDKLDTCPNQNGVDQGLDPINNYMNYIYGECFRDYGRFTDDQRRRMRAQWQKWRAPKRK